MFFANSRCPVFSFCPTLKLPNINLHYRFYGQIERLELHIIALHNDISITSLNNISPFHGTYSNNDPKVYYFWNNLFLSAKVWPQMGIFSTSLAQQQYCIYIFTKFPCTQHSSYKDVLLGCLDLAVWKLKGHLDTLLLTLLHTADHEKKNLASGISPPLRTLGLGLCLPSYLHKP